MTSINTLTVSEPANSPSYEVSHEQLIRLLNKLVYKWADHINDMPPRLAQKFIGENLDRLRDDLAPTCGAEFTAMLTSNIERSVWSMYEQLNPPSSAI